MQYATYEPVIGLEVHCQLSTEGKAFSPEAALSGGEPNTRVDPVSLGHPGTLPVLNRRALSYALRLGLATHCCIAERATFARKHYFYPDLPKGYQITQYDAPLCYDGYVEIPRNESEPTGGDGQTGRTRRVEIRRIHLEEDAGKSLHDRDAETTRVDFNRCGVPLVEIVLAPDLRSPHEARHALRRLRRLVRYLGVSNGNMAEGSLRCDVNVSVRPRGREALGTKTEVKNLNSLRHLEQALAHEVARQMRVREGGGVVKAQTLRWDEELGETRPLRTKEEAPDYRYFPDPDLTPIVITDRMRARARRALPEMPERRRRRFIEEWGLPDYDAGVLTEERAVADYFEAVLDVLFKRAQGGNTQRQAKAVANFVMTDVLHAVSDRADGMEDFPVEPERLAALIHLRLQDEINSSAAQEIFEIMGEEEGTPEAIARERNLMQISDEEALAPLIDNILDRHEKNVHRYRSGKKSLLKFFIGQVMAHHEGSPDPQVVRQLLKRKLKAKRTG